LLRFERTAAEAPASSPMGTLSRFLLMCESEQAVAGGSMPIPHGTGGTGAWIRRRTRSSPVSGLTPVQSCPRMSATLYASRSAHPLGEKRVPLGRLRATPQATAADAAHSTGWSAARTRGTSFVPSEGMTAKRGLAGHRRRQVLASHERQQRIRACSGRSVILAAWHRPGLRYRARLTMEW
jgi:hypothetical protein